MTELLPPPRRLFFIRRLSVCLCVLIGASRQFYQDIFGQRDTINVCKSSASWSASRNFWKIFQRCM